MRLPVLLAPLLLSGVMHLVPVPLAEAGEAASSSSEPSASSSSLPSATAGGFGAALNEFRARHGLSGLREDRHLSAAAQAYAEDMARHGYFSHQGRDGSTHVQRARAAGCSGRGYFAENIAWGQRSAQDAFSGWAGSAGHRENMLGRAYGVYGLGQSQGMWVLMFADGC